MPETTVNNVSIVIILNATQFEEKTVARGRSSGFLRLIAVKTVVVGLMG